MKLLYLIPQLYNAGGMERVLSQKANWLAKHTDWEILIATTELTPKGLPVSHFALDSRIRVRELNMDFDADFGAFLPVRLVRHQQKMRQYKRALQTLIREEKVDACISLCGKEIAFLSELPCPTLAELHFAKNQRKQILEAHHPNSAFWAILGDIRTWQLVQDVKRIRKLIVLTEADKQAWMEARCPHVEVLPNPCALDGRDLPTVPREKEVLAVGRLHPQKGFDLLLEAWKRVEAERPDWRLTIVGEGPERESLQARLTSLGLQRACLAGAHQGIERDYMRASVLAMSSHYEGLPLALIEGMWCGLPCVSFRCPHGPAELLADGRGILVEKGHVEGLAEALLRITKDAALREEMGEKAQTYAHARFSEEAIMHQWLQQIDNLIH